MGELIAVLSGKGGTGKTSVCAGIASAMAQLGEQVLCIDCDMGLGNLDMALGVQELSSLSFLEVSEGGYGLDQATKHPQYPNLRFLTAPINGLPEQVDTAAFGTMLNQAKAQYRYVFLDGSAGIGTAFGLVARFADRILLVTDTDPVSIRVATRAGEALELLGKTNVRLIVNRLDKKAMAAMALTVDDLMDRIGLPLLGVIPEDPGFALPSKKRLPDTRRGAAAAYQRIAKRIQGHQVPVSF